MAKFRGTYRAESARMRKWDYGWCAMYFITICTGKRIIYFGDVKNGHMKLSEVGQKARDEWLKTFDLRPDMNLYKGEFVVMPNHVHAIIGIGKNPYNTRCGPIRPDDTDLPDSSHTSGSNKNSGPGKNSFGPQSKNLASIIRGYKSAVTVFARCMYPDFEWQPRFHDRIIRNRKAFRHISQYIINNPSNWNDDIFYKSP